MTWLGAAQEQLSHGLSAIFLSSLSFGVKSLKQWTVVQASWRPLQASTSKDLPLPKFLLVLVKMLWEWKWVGFGAVQISYLSALLCRTAPTWGIYVAKNVATLNPLHHCPISRLIPSSNLFIRVKLCLSCGGLGTCTKMMLASYLSTVYSSWVVQSGSQVPPWSRTDHRVVLSEVWHPTSSTASANSATATSCSLCISCVQNTK